MTHLEVDWRVRREGVVDAVQRHVDVRQRVQELRETRRLVLVGNARRAHRDASQRHLETESTVERRVFGAQERNLLVHRTSINVEHVSIKQLHSDFAFVSLRKFSRRTFWLSYQLS